MSDCICECGCKFVKWSDKVQDYVCSECGDIVDYDPNTPDDDDPSYICPKCHGTGLSWDGLGECENCDGMGYEWWW